MIEQGDCTKQEGVYFYQGRLWRVLSYCPGPSVSLVPVEEKPRLGESNVVSFGLGGLIDMDFIAVDGLKYNHKEGRLEEK